MKRIVLLLLGLMLSSSLLGWEKCIFLNDLHNTNIRIQALFYEEKGKVAETPTIFRGEKKCKDGSGKLTGIDIIWMKYGDEKINKMSLPDWTLDDRIKTIVVTPEHDGSDLYIYGQDSQTLSQKSAKTHFYRFFPHRH